MQSDPTADSWTHLTVDPTDAASFWHTNDEITGTLKRIEQALNAIQLRQSRLEEAVLRLLARRAEEEV